MKKKTPTQPTKSCSDCIHETACRMWTDWREISNDSASRCPNHTTTKESAAYLIGKMDGEKSAIPVDEHRKQDDLMDKFEAVDKFRDALMDEFLRLCCYNDYSKLTLLKIGDTIDRVYDKCVESMKGGAE